MSRRHRWILWCAALVGVAALIVLMIGSYRHQVTVQRADDPRSTTGAGAKALAQMLEDSGVQVEATDSVDDAVARSDSSTLLVVASADRLTGEQAARIGGATYGRLVLLRPGAVGLRAFGIPADTAVRTVQTVDPACDEPAAELAGVIDAGDYSYDYVSIGATVSVRCYPAGEGAGWLRVGGPFGPVDIVAGGVSNDVLAQEGNAAFGMNVFGSHPRIVWLMAQQAAAAGEQAQGPGLLPAWWPPAVVQAFVALVVVGIWRGRRLGPILREPLPVSVRAAETVQGHGRLYARIGARDRAGEALRAGVRDRLSRAYGLATSLHSTSEHPTEDDRLALSAAVAARTGRPAPEVHRLLFGPPPGTDDELTALAQHLDRLEQEARQL